jgi:hypothetical protein
MDLLKRIQKYLKEEVMLVDFTISIEVDDDYLDDGVKESELETKLNKVLSDLDEVIGTSEFNFNDSSWEYL